MNIYLVDNNTRFGYDTYDSVVVVAESVDEARKIHPSSFVTHVADGRWKGTNISGETYNTGDNEWVRYDEIDELVVELIGKTTREKGVVLASFNAG